MRPRNVLTETNDIRRMMGLPLLKEDSGQTINDVKKKVLNESTIEYEDDQWLVIDKEEDKEEDKEDVNEDRSFSLGFGNAGGLTIAEEEVEEIPEGTENIEKIVIGCIGNHVSVEDLQSIPDVCIKMILNKDLTQAIPCGIAGMNADTLIIIKNNLEPIFNCVAAEVGVSPLGETTEENIREEGKDVIIKKGKDGKFYPTDMAEEEDPMEENLTEGSFAKYNITLHDKDTKQNITEGWFAYDGEIDRLLNLITSDLAKGYTNLEKLNDVAFDAKDEYNNGFSKALDAMGDVESYLMDGVTEYDKED